jgi:heme exporter protein A
MIITLTSLALSRGGRALFSGLSLTLAAGEACALTGANGAGKTSLLRAVAGLIRADAGEIAVTVPFHFVGHQDGLKPARTAREELVFWSLWDGGTEASAQDAAGMLDLAPLLDLEVRRLSAGQRRRLALARLLAAPRPLWLLDEPLSPLDAAWRERFGRIMQTQLESGGTILAAVHDPLPIKAISLELTAPEARA